MAFKDWFNSKSNWMKGGLIGLMFSIPYLGWGMFGVCQSYGCSGNFHGLFLGMYVLYAAGFFIIGSILGAIIGLIISKIKYKK